MSTASLETVVTDALEELKAVDVRVLDVGGLTTITDTMIVASGTSDRHVKALSSKVVEAAKAHGERPLGIEGQEHGEWVLVDLGGIIVHVMLPRVRDFYNLERLWEMSESHRRRREAGAPE